MSLQEKQIQSVRDIPIRFFRPHLLAQILEDLKHRGYRLQFRREATCLYCNELSQWISPESFVVDEYYHFEDASSTDEARTLYAITVEEGKKGFLVDACLVYEDNISNEMMQKLRWEYEIRA
ncbi:phosphoribosylpyrophosphate synthetase [Pseudoflavitalea rhizosphaerae]|uniref:phosphoribosylpyrophosphate synthetase n=1 Tax=Pseudoflavitalea rhizosphaerae TaxID=1884793 RepID=UPI000F8E938F|nr:phosphoribosylpyrophosphate synthetase [Pseudoflavitalea rhizosphaerae]